MKRYPNYTETKIRTERVRTMRGSRGIFIPENVWKKVLQEYENGWTIKDLAKRVGCSKTALSNLFKKKGVVLRTRGPMPGKIYPRKTFITQRSMEQRVEDDLNLKRAELIETMIDDPDEDFTLLETKIKGGLNDPGIG